MNKKVYLFGVILFATLFLTSLTSAYSYYPSTYSYSYPSTYSYSYPSSNYGSWGNYGGYNNNYEKEIYYKKGAYTDYFPGGSETTKYYTKTTRNTYYSPTYSYGYNYPYQNTYTSDYYYHPRHYYNTNGGYYDWRYRNSYY
jgi:hypothetical protein